MEGAGTVKHFLLGEGDVLLLLFVNKYCYPLTGVDLGCHSFSGGPQGRYKTPFCNCNYLPHLCSVAVVGELRKRQISI